MKLSSLEDLRKQIKQGLSLVYLICSDEYLLKQDAIAAIKEKALSQGYLETIIFNIDNHSDPHLFIETTQTYSLFSSKRFIEIRLDENNKIPEAFRAALQDYCSQPSADYIVVISAAKLDASAQKTAWVKAAEQCGVMLTLWPLPNYSLTNYVKERCTQKGLQLTTEGIAFLIEQTQGNLLATAQEIEKLTLLYPQGPISLAQLAENCANSSHYDVFNLNDAALLGQGSQVCKILQRLQQEGIEPTIILWALVREIRQLTDIAQALSQGIPLSQALAQHHVWEKRKPLISQAIKTHSLASLQQLLKLAAEIDKTIKGVQIGNVWNLLEQLTLKLAGIRISVHAF
jgi:DNA polymerase-3 subunit delta